MRMRKALAAAATTLVLTTGACVAVAPAAAADASGCHDRVCVNVPGHDNYVGKVTVSITLNERGSATGRFYILRSGKTTLRSSVRHLKNESYINSHTWSDSYRFDAHLTEGDRICGKFADNGYVYGEACETVG